jgi:drug/metabolite transporter (DMT)-like permease
VSRSTKAHLLLLLITLIWGATFVVIKNALTDISPLLFNAVRMSLAAVLLAAIFHREIPGIKASTFWTGAMVGAFLFLGNELQTTGLKYTSASKSAFLTGLSVVLVPVFLALFWRRGINRWSLAGVALAFLGLYFVTMPAGAGLHFDSINHGDVLTLGAAVVFAFHIILIGHSTQRHRWQQINVSQVIATAVLMIITVPFGEQIHVVWSARVISGVLITACLSLALAFSVQAWAQQFTPPTHTALIFSLEPVFAWLTSFLVLGERLSARASLGAACIVVGVLISEEKGSAESLAVAPDHAGVPATGGDDPVSP